MNKLMEFVDELVHCNLMFNMKGLKNEKGELIISDALAQFEGDMIPQTKAKIQAIADEWERNKCQKLLLAESLMFIKDMKDTPDNLKEYITRKLEECGTYDR